MKTSLLDHMIGPIREKFQMIDHREEIRYKGTGKRRTMEMNRSSSMSAGKRCVPRAMILMGP